MASMFLVEDPSKPENKTFFNDDKLPSLPVPTVSQTLEKYLDSCRAILTSEDYEKTKAICAKFAEKDAIELQERLLQRASEHRNWLEQWWLEKGYLETRIPLPIQNFSGPGTYLEHVWPIQAGKQLERMALGQYLFLRFWKIVREERMAPHLIKKGKYLSMHQFRYLFNTCRIPHKGRDNLYHGFRTEAEGKSATHIIVLCQGYIFKINAVSSDGEILTPPQFYGIHKKIKEICQEREKPGPGIPALTSLHRDRWADLRQHLLSISSKNQQAMNDIETSIFVSAMDETSPRNYTEISYESMVGDANLRWYDKSYTCAYGENGTCNVVCEHSPYDAMVIIALVEFMTSSLKQLNGVWPGSLETEDFPPPVEITFDLDQKVVAAVSEAKVELSKLRQNLDLVQIVFCKFGKSALKEFQIHPDFMVQLCLQLAYMHIHGKPGPTYETAMTRQFYHGRTETCRTCTPEVVKFCKAMLQHPEARSAEHQQLLSLLHEAHKKYLSLMEDCSQNKGCDRHLMGLVLIAIENGLEIPELYTDKAFAETGGNGNFVLSTSCVGYMSGQGSVSPMLENGYGCFYRINDHKLIYSVSAYRSCPDTDAQKFADCFEYYLSDVLFLLKTTNTTAKL